MTFTIITVAPDPDIERHTTVNVTDRIWLGCKVDGKFTCLRITVRNWHSATDGHGNPTLPISVYIDGGAPLYPTYVYDDDGVLLAVDFGKVGAL